MFQCRASAVTSAPPLVHPASSRSPSASVEPILDFRMDSGRRHPGFQDILDFRIYSGRRHPGFQDILDFRMDSGRRHPEFQDILDFRIYSDQSSSPNISASKCRIATIPGADGPRWVRRRNSGGLEAYWRCGGPALQVGDFSENQNSEFFFRAHSGSICRFFSKHTIYIIKPPYIFIIILRGFGVLG